MPPIFFAILPIIFWGSSFLATKVLLKNNFSPMLISFLRFFFVSLFLTIIPNKPQKIDATDWKYFLIMGIFGVTLFYYFENTGLKFTTIANTSLITATIPLFTMLYARIFLKKALLPTNILGIPLSLFGTLLLFYKDISYKYSHLKGDLFVFISVFLWIAYSFSYQKISNKYPQISILKYISYIGTISMLPFVLRDLINLKFSLINFVSILSIMYLSVFCTLFAYLLWNKGILKLGIKLTSNLILFIPIISIAFGIIVWDEKFSFNLVWATILILLGSYFSSQKIENNEF